MWGTIKHVKCLFPQHVGKWMFMSGVEGRSPGRAQRLESQHRQILKATGGHLKSEWRRTRDKSENDLYLEIRKMKRNQ